MNTIIKGRTTPNIRHTIKGILLAEMLNKHLKQKIEKQKKKELEELYDIELISSDEETPLLKK
jgi:hypothetical protein